MMKNPTIFIIFVSYNLTTKMWRHPTVLKKMPCCISRGKSSIQNGKSFIRKFRQLLSVDHRSNTNGPVS
jgi:hypothetical protein